MVLGLVPVSYWQMCRAPNEIGKDDVSTSNCGQEEHEGNLAWSTGLCVPEELFRAQQCLQEFFFSTQETTDTHACQDLEHYQGLKQRSKPKYSSIIGKHT